MKSSPDTPWAIAKPFWSQEHKRRLAPPFVKLRGRDSPAELFQALESANVLSLPSLLALGDGEFNRLAFLKTAVAIALNGGEMYEDILTVLTRDKTKAFGGIEPLHCSLFHLLYFPIC
jgi:hypothetical protein